MTLRYEKSEYLTFASCQIVATSNEDRVAALLHHKKSGAEKFSSFGVFDGHQGVRKFHFTFSFTLA
jgi:serine/threonine protein phosphatase PrpC